MSMLETLEKLKEQLRYLQTIESGAGPATDLRSGIILDVLQNLCEWRKEYEELRGEFLKAQIKIAALKFSVDQLTALGDTHNKCFEKSDGAPPEVKR